MIAIEAKALQQDADALYDLTAFMRDLDNEIAASLSMLDGIASGSADCDLPETKNECGYWIASGRYNNTMLVSEGRTRADAILGWRALAARRGNMS